MFGGFLRGTSIERFGNTTKPCSSAGRNDRPKAAPLRTGMKKAAPILSAAAQHDRDVNQG